MASYDQELYSLALAAGDRIRYPITGYDDQPDPSLCRGWGALCSMSNFENFVASVRWQLAKTMPDWPHEYTVKDWRPDLARAFVAFCSHIELHGTQEPWPPPPAHAIYHNRYLVLGDYRYWAMGPSGDCDPPGSKTVINRTQESHDLAAPSCAAVVDSGSVHALNEVARWEAGHATRHDVRLS